MIRITLTIPAPVVRAGMQALIGSLPEAIIVSSDARAADPAALEASDVWIVQPAEDGLGEITRGLADLGDPPALLVIGADQFDLRPLAGLTGLAWGVLPLDATVQELAAALAALQAGLVVGLPGLLAPIAPAGPVDADLAEPLTEREQEVLRLLALGWSNKQIAAGLVISEHTAKFHISSIYGKLGAANRTEAVRVGLQRGLLAL